MSQKPLKADLLKVGHCTHPECIVLRGGRWSAIEFPALAGLIDHPERGLILYDTGYSKRFFEATRSFPECLYRMVTPPSLPPEEELLAQLAERNIEAADIGTIIISHFHADHVAGLRDFPNARFISTRDEYHEVLQKGRVQRLRNAFLTELIPADFLERADNVEEQPRISTGLPVFENGYDLLGDGSLIGIALPGHTRSQLGVLMATDDHRKLFFVGDACWKLEGLETRSMPSSIASLLFADKRRYAETFGRLADLAAMQPSLAIIPSHCTTAWSRYGNTRHVFRA